MGQIAAGQTKTPIPSVSGQPIYYDSSLHSLTKLEAAEAKFSHRRQGRSAVTTTFALGGGKSFVRLRFPANGCFLVRLGDSDGEPSEWFTLFKADTAVEKRLATLIQGKKTPTVTAESLGGGIVPFEAKKLNDNLYEIIPSIPLNQGEYFFINKIGPAHERNSVHAYAFGVD